MTRRSPSRRARQRANGTAPALIVPEFVGLDPRDGPTDYPVLPDGTYFAVDANCPSCGWPERRARFDEHGAVFSCRKCEYVSREREA